MVVITSDIVESYQFEPKSQYGIEDVVGLKYNDISVGVSKPVHTIATKLN